MKTTTLAIILMALTTSLCLALPGGPEANGLTPASGTFYANTNFYDNGGAESDNIDIAANGNVLIGWEDDGGGIYDFEAVWSVFSSNGTNLTPWTQQTNRDVSGYGASGTNHFATTNTYLSFFRSDDTAIPAYTGWGPKIKANRWGNGMGMGASPWEIGLEIPELFDINLDDGGGDDFPCVQLLNNDGTPLRPGVINGVTNLGIVTISDENFQPAGAVRIADWDYLSNGNIILAGESRQVADRALTGQTNGNVPVIRIVTPSGIEVVPYKAASESGQRAWGDMWHGVGVTANGFAMRWASPDGIRVRMFDNAANPTTTNINLVAATGHPEDGTGGRGGGNGFHGNGRDGYVCVSPGLTNYAEICTSNHIVIITNNPGPGETYVTNTICDTSVTNITWLRPWVTVLNTNGTVRWSRAIEDAGDPIDNTQNSDVDGAIAPDGRVIAVWASPLTNATDPTKVVDTIQARLFSPCGTPLGDRFVVSEWESPTNSAFVIDYSVIDPPDIYPASPRVAWRGNQVAISWVSMNPPYVGLGVIPVIGARTFTVTASAPPTALAIAKSGGNVTISWSGGGTLESADGIAGPWTPIYDCSPYTTAASSAEKLFRVRGW